MNLCADDDSAGAVTIYKCTTLTGLLRIGDFTCMYSDFRLSFTWC